VNTGTDLVRPALEHDLEAMNEIYMVPPRGVLHRAGPEVRAVLGWCVARRALS
jgi:hypothetical protein